ncbi:unnamed protein product, partial [Porites evermanni]
MTNMLEKKFVNNELGIEINSYIDKQQNVWFRGKDVAEILGFKDSVNALKRHVSLENKMIQLIQPKTRGGVSPPQQNETRGGVSPPQQNETRGRQQNVVKSRGRETRPQQNDTRGKYCTFINEPGFYELVFGSKLETAKKFRQWVFNTVLPSIRK